MSDVQHPECAHDFRFITNNLTMERSRFLWLKGTGSLKLVHLAPMATGCVKTAGAASRACPEWCRKRRHKQDPFAWYSTKAAVEKDAA